MYKIGKVGVGLFFWYIFDVTNIQSTGLSLSVSHQKWGFVTHLFKQTLASHPTELTAK